MPLDSFILEGTVNVSSETKRTMSPAFGRLVFDFLKWSAWRCTVQQPNVKPVTYLLNNLDINRIPANFVEAASQGNFYFHHNSGDAIVQLWCEPSKASHLEDAVTLILAMNKGLTFKEGQEKFADAVHETFHKYGLDSSAAVHRHGIHPRMCENYYYGSGRSPRNRRDRRGSYGGMPYRVPSKEQFHNGSFKSNFGEYRRNDSYYTRGKMRSPPKYHNNNNNNNNNNYGRNTNNGKFNGYRSRRLLDSPSDEYRNRSEHVSRREQSKQQPLKDRGSAENSLDRSEDEREVSRDVLLHGQSQAKNKQEKSSKSNTSVRNEAADSEHDPPIRGPERSAPPLSSSFRDVDKSPAKVDSESPLGRGTFYGKVNSNRQYGAKKSPSSSPYRPQNCTFTKRNGQIWNSSSGKKSKYGSPNKENELCTSVPSNRNSCSEPGFKNIGLTCYMNTGLWSLFKAEVFSQDLILAYNSIKDSLEGDSILRNVCNLLQATRLPDKSKCDDSYRDLLENIREAISKRWPGFNVHAMQDTQEFIQKILHSMMDELDDKLKATSGKLNLSVPLNPIRKNFEFELEELLVCVNCSRTCSKRDIHYNMGVSVLKSKVPGSSKSLQTAIKSFFKIEERESICSNCQHVKCRVESKISKLPRVLMVYLKRYIVKKISRDVTKNSWPVDIPKYISLRDFTAVGASLNFSDVDDTDERINMSSDSHSTVDSAFESINGTISSDAEQAQPLVFDDFRLRTGPNVESGGAGDAHVDLTQVPEIVDQQTDGCQASLLNDTTGVGVDGTVGEKRTSTPVNENNIIVDFTSDEAFNEAISQSLLQGDEDHDAQIENAKRLSLQELKESTAEVPELDDDEVEEEGEDDDDEAYLSDANYSTGELPNSYRLVSIATHSGSLYNGHYVCINYNSDSKWKIYNDDKVESISEDTAMQRARNDGYVMFYIHKSLMERHGDN